MGFDGIAVAAVEFFHHRELLVLVWELAAVVLWMGFDGIAVAAQEFFHHSELPVLVWELAAVVLWMGFDGIAVAAVEFFHHSELPVLVYLPVFCVFYSGVSWRRPFYFYSKDWLALDSRMELQTGLDNFRTQLEDTRG